MKLFKKNIKNSRAPKPSLEIQERAFRDWKIMLGVFSLLIVAAVLIDGYLFLKLREGNFFADTNEISTVDTTVGRKSLIEVDKYFSERQAEYEIFKNNPPAEIDPSI